MDWLVGVANAQINLGLPFNQGKANYSNFNDYFVDLINFSVVVASLIAVVIIIYAGLNYVQSQGQADKASHAKELIAGALTGLGLLLMIRLILPTLDIGARFTNRVYAQGPAKVNTADPVNLDGTFLSALTLDQLFGRIIYWLAVLLALAAFSGIVYSGYMIITSGGDPGQAAKGRSNLLWSILGVVVALSAYAIVQFAFSLTK